MATLLEGAHHFRVGTLVYGSDATDGYLRKLLIDFLAQNNAVEATHTASARFKSPKCYPQTRIAVKHDISEWIRRDGAVTTQRILWLTGPGGAGKTAIAGSLAEMGQEQWLAATFFFSDIGRPSYCRSKKRFIGTLVYQLIRHPQLPGLEEHVLAAIQRDPAVFERLLKEQVELLILGPLRKISPPSFKEANAAILIDGLDECAAGDPERSDSQPGDSTQQSKEVAHEEILCALLHAVNDPSFPFHIIVTSRPEPTIRRFFSQNRAITTEVFLDERYNPNADIDYFIRRKLDEIRIRLNPAPSSWPRNREEVVNTLVTNASGQFVYAATVMRYIEDTSENPEARLDRILNWEVEMSRSTHNPFERLDALYSRIVKTSPEPLVAVTWIHAILELHTESSDSVEKVRAFLEPHTGEMGRLLENLSSLLSITNTFRFYHKSFLEFLTSEFRSGTLYVDPVNTRLFLEHRWHQILKNRGPQVHLNPRVRASFLQYYAEVLTVRYFHPFPHLHPWNYDSEDIKWWATILTACAEPIDLREAKVIRILEIVHEQCSRFSCSPHCEAWRSALQTTHPDSFDVPFIAMLDRHQALSLFIMIFLFPIVLLIATIAELSTETGRRVPHPS